MTDTDITPEAVERLAEEYDSRVEAFDGFMDETPESVRELRRERNNPIRQMHVKTADTLRALSARVTQLEAENAEAVLAEFAVWQPIETAPEGVSRIKGAAKVCWMLLAWPDGEGGIHTGHGMRVNNEFYSVSVFHCGGPFDGKQYEFREVEVYPTHWMPRPAPPVRAMGWME